MRYISVMTSSIEIDLLYFDGCPSYETAWQLLSEVVSEHGLKVTINPVNIDSLDKANRFHFAGSPTIRVNGEDLEGYSGEGVMACRVYKENGGRGWPSKRLLEKRLLAAL